MWLSFVCFCFCLCFCFSFCFFIFFVIFVYCTFLATMPLAHFAGYFLVRCFLSAFLRNCSRFDLIWFCLSCDHGWFRSGSSKPPERSKGLGGNIVWCPCMAINVSAQHNGGFLPDIILFPRGYYHMGTRLNAMRFCLCSL